VASIELKDVAKVSPGTVLMRLLMECCIGRRFLHTRLWVACHA
jgi:hypothetical protein